MCIVKRGDPFYKQTSHEVPDNDFDDWARYSRIEDTVLRVHYMDTQSGLVGYEHITSPDVISSMNAMETVLQDMLTEKTERNYRVINNNDLHNYKRY